MLETESQANSCHEHDQTQDIISDGLFPVQPCGAETRHRVGSSHQLVLAGRVCGAAGYKLYGHSALERGPGRNPGADASRIAGRSVAGRSALGIRVPGIGRRSGDGNPGACPARSGESDRDGHDGSQRPAPDAARQRRRRHRPSRAVPCADVVPNGGQWSGDARQTAGGFVPARLRRLLAWSGADFRSLSGDSRGVCRSSCQRRA